MQLKNVSNKIFLVFGGLHVPIFLNLKKCFLRKKVKVTLTFLNGTICFWHRRIVTDLETYYTMTLKWWLTDDYGAYMINTYVHNMESDESTNYSDNEKSNTQNGAMNHSLSFQSHSIIHCWIRLDISNNPTISKIYGTV